MSFPAYKVCAVPFCTSTTIKTPKKMFIHVPEKLEIRQKWLQLAGRHHATVSPKYSMYYCEDHFDLPKDMENYMKFKLMGSVGKIRMKPQCLPSKFACQQDRGPSAAASASAPRLTKKQKTMLMCNFKSREIEDSNIPSASGTTRNLDHVNECGETGGGSGGGGMALAGVRVKEEPGTRTGTGSDSVGPGAVAEPEAVYVKQEVFVKEEPPWSAESGEELPAQEFQYEIKLEPECVLAQPPPDPLRPSSLGRGSSTESGSAAEDAEEDAAEDAEEDAAEDVAPKTGYITRLRPAGTKTYVCHACGQVFPQKPSLIRHIPSCLEKNPDMFPGNLNASTNERIKKPYSCETCNKEFTQLCHLTEHTRIHTGDKPYPCEICKKEFTNASHLKNHKRIHTGEKPYSCDLCNKGFAQLSNLKRHKEVHLGTRSFPCDVCKKEFTQLGHLKNHIRTHTGEKPHICEICKKEFSQLSNLKRHEEIHMEQVKKTYSCEICKKEFPRSIHLTTHMRGHSGDKPYACKICKKEFVHLGNFKRHEQMHERPQSLSCELCKKEFADARDLKRHQRVHAHEMPYSCDMCNKRFWRQSDVKRHVRVMHDAAAAP